MISRIIIASSFLVLCFIVGKSVTFKHLSKGESCVIHSNNRTGICKLLSDCPLAINQLKEKHEDNLIFPQICTFEGTIPIVCCSNVVEDRISQRVPGVISQQKCKEYAKYYIVKTKIPTLSIGEDDEYVEENKCGHTVEELIVGGTEAKEGEFPHMATLGYGDDVNNAKWGCGGSIISENYVLTAAHCLGSQSRDSPSFVKIGISNLTENSTHLQIFHVDGIIKHEGYKRSAHYNDIGLIKLDKPIVLNPHAIPACLYSKSEISAAKAIASGWGTTAFHGYQSEALLKVTLDLLEEEKCDIPQITVTLDKRFSSVNESTQMCAGSRNASHLKDTCQADSGGPLQIYHIGDEDVQCMYDIVGITSFGKGCGHLPSLYTKVFPYVKWIEDKVWPA